MTIAILEPHASGHRAGYVRWIAEGLERAGRSVLIGGGGELMAHPAVRELLDSSGGVRSVQLEAPRPARGGTSRLASIARQFAYRSYFSRLYAKAAQGADIRGVVVPYLDYCLYAMAALGAPFAASPWCGITMRSGGAASNGSMSPQSAALRLLTRSASVRGIFSIDPRIQQQAGARGQAAGWPLRYIADPVSQPTSGDRARMRAALGIADSTVVVTVFGTLDRRKGIACLLDGMLHAGSELPVMVLLAGQQTSATHELLAAPRFRQLVLDQRISAIDRYIDEADLADVLAGSDAVWLGYIGHQHMSGVLLLAAVSRLPIIATRAGAIGFVASQLSETSTVDPKDAFEVAAALRRLVMGQCRRRAPAEAQKLADSHSPLKFGADIAAVFS